MTHGLVRVLAAAAALAVALVATGCSCKESEQPKPKIVVAQPKAQPAPQQAQPGPQNQAQPGKDHKVGESILHAPGDYLETVVINVPRKARKDLDTATVGHEVQEFNALEGRYPYSLKELEQWRGEPLPKTPKGYTYKYDPSTGKVEVVPMN